MMGQLHRAFVLVMATATLADAQPTTKDQPAAAPTPSESSAVEEAMIADAPPASEDREEDVSDFDKLRTPDSPAFAILGVSPTEIQRPTTPKGFVAALGGFVTGAGTGLAVPSSFALEVAPYWLLPHRDLSISRYRSQHLARPLRTLSFSIGTTETKRTETDAAGEMVEHTDSNIGLGFRTMLFQRGADDECTRKANSNATRQAQEAVLTGPERQKLAEAGEVGSAEYNAAFKKLVRAKIDAKLRTDKCVALVASTNGFTIGMAGAFDVRAADSRLTRAGTSLAGYGLWMDMSYDTKRLSAIAMARITARKHEMVNREVFDAGFRGIYKLKSYAISAEALLRYRFAEAYDATTYKLDMAIEYEVISGTWLSFSFGKDFAFAPGDAGSLFSMANLKWGIGKPTI